MHFSLKSRSRAPSSDEKRCLRADRLIRLESLVVDSEFLLLAIHNELNTVDFATAIPRQRDMLPRVGFQDLIARGDFDCGIGPLVNEMGGETFTLLASSMAPS